MRGWLAVVIVLADAKGCMIKSDIWSLFTTWRKSGIQVGLIPPFDSPIRTKLKDDLIAQGCK